MKTSQEEIKQTHSTAEEYELLKGHFRTDGSYKTDDELRMEYIHLTDRLIHKMTHGVEVYDPIAKVRTTKQPDTVIFLDKSARPLAWLVNDLWDKLAIDDDGNIAKKPDFKFLNIDRNQWINGIDPEGVGTMNIDNIDESVIRSLRSVFVSPLHKKDGLTDEIDDSPASLDGHTVLVVDEVAATGRTLRIAHDFLERAFPTASIAGTHWMGGITERNGARGNLDLPVWYKKDDPTGRGVNDRHKNPSGKDIDNLTQRLGAWFLSTRFSEVDQAALQLRKEFKKLADDDNVPVRPDYDRLDFLTDEGVEKYERHLSRVNGDDDVSRIEEKIKALRRSSK